MTQEARPLLERVGVAYFRRLSAGMPAIEAVDEVHVLNAGELSELRGIQRGVIARAAIVGALSGLASALAELYAVARIGGDPDAYALAQVIEFWVIVGGVTGIATVFEIGFLYWDALRSVHRLARAAGLPLFDEGGGRAEVAHALARAALELPNPPGRVFGVDPHREISKARLVAIALAYKLKIGVTSFLLKALLRRVLGRAAVRVWLVFVAVPVTAAWNGIVAWLVIRQARLRAMGPSAAAELASRLLRDAELSDTGKLAVLRAVAAAIVRTHDPHPNLIAFLAEVRAYAGEGNGEDVDDTRAFIEALPALPKPEQDVVLRVLCVGAILDGKLARDERRLIEEAYRAAGREPRTDAVDRLRRAFTRGRPIGDDVLASLVDRER